MNTVKKLREELNLTQEQLADLLETSRQTISNIEAGRYYPKTWLAFRFEIFFKVPMEQLFLKEEDIQWQPKKINTSASK